MTRRAVTWLPAPTPDPVDVALREALAVVFAHVVAKRVEDDDADA